MAKIEADQFEGCLIGVLVGDCLGFPFENEMSHSYSREKIQTFFDSIYEDEDHDTIQYTDDTSMTKAVAQSLVECKSFDVKDIAKRFTNTYNTEERERSYGSHVHAVFHGLKTTNYNDVFEPASKQFNGTGSFGNGSGMRVAPIVLHSIADPDLTALVTMTVQTSRITHTHPKGIVGALFQALAIRQGLLYGLKRKEGNTNIDPVDILNAFEEDFKLLSAGKIQLPPTIPSFQNGYEDYLDKLTSIRKLLLEGNDNLNVANVKASLGVKVTAVESIPTAFFCFLAAFKDVPFVQAENQFQRTVQLAVAIGGDSDTIAAMAGAIAGGFLGRSGIPDEFVTICEDYEGVTALSKSLYEKYIA